MNLSFCKKNNIFILIKKMLLVRGTQHGVAGATGSRPLMAFLSRSNLEPSSSVLLEPEQHGAVIFGTSRDRAAWSRPGRLRSFLNHNGL